MAWELCEKPACTTLEEDRSNSDTEDRFRGTPWICRETGDRYLEATFLPSANGGYIASDPPQWLRWVDPMGAIYFHCPDHPETLPVNTGIRRKRSVWDAVGPAGNSISDCTACGGEHTLTRENCEFREDS